uniref:Uncharacterized protein n=1 Tax=Macaca nemestrina TaxID=9545 RepID=A0A2K6CUC1_MACNE
GTGPPGLEGAQAGPRSPAVRRRGPRAPSWGRPGRPAAHSPWACGPPHWGPQPGLHGEAAARPGPRSRWHRRCAAACGACAQRPGHQLQLPGAGAPQPGAACSCLGPRPQRTPRLVPSRPGWCAGPRRRHAPGTEPHAAPGRAPPPHAGASPGSRLPPGSPSLPLPAATWRTWGQESKVPGKILKAWDPFSLLSPFLLFPPLSP